MAAQHFHLSPHLCNSFPQTRILLLQPLDLTRWRLFPHFSFVLLWRKIVTDTKEEVLCLNPAWSHATPHLSSRHYPLSVTATIFIREAVIICKSPLSPPRSGLPTADTPQVGMVAHWASPTFWPPLLHSPPTTMRSGPHCSWSRSVSGYTWTVEG